MKMEATIVLKLQASSLGEAGAALDDLLGRAHERDDVEVNRVNVVTPPGVAPVSLPTVSAPSEYPPGMPRTALG